MKEIPTTFFPRSVWGGLCIAAISLSFPVSALCALSANGNDFALYYSEARSDAERKELLGEAGRRPHYFRYLQIMEMEKTEGPGRPQVRITALEPASALDVVFIIDQPVSLSKLKEEPVSAPGRALAVSGVIERIDPKTRTIHLHPVVVRHKDRLAPVSGKEMLYEIDDRSQFYSFTGGKEPISLSFRDRDLLQHRDRIMKEGGDQAWADFLKQEIRRREADRKAGKSEP